MASSDYLYHVSSIKMQIEARHQKLYLFETFWLFFFTDRIYRGARAPKNKSNLSLNYFKYTSRGLNFAYKKLELNTSLAAPGALVHCLQCRTACKNQNGHQGAPTWPTGSGKGLTIGYSQNNFR